MSKPFFEERNEYIQGLYQAINKTKEMLDMVFDSTLFVKVLQQLFYMESIVVAKGRRPRSQEGGNISLHLDELRRYAAQNPIHMAYAQSILQLYNSFIRYSKEADSRPKLVKESAIACLKRLNIAFNKVSEPEYRKNEELQLGKDDGTSTMDVWVIPYTYTVFQQEDAFIYLDDRYFELIYILTPHGYIKG